ncbi:NAD-dependent succinate-semialdehyde dehydrogenase [Nonomuraea glycinis]|uniref:NAD-dependent succinate-semialdehyde dehydrogenase n=1 Tax=Nonomuraea glycinis TaxID=2047744 RepID=A0A918A5W5_9ACTN|nr:NAD-dependent succinate-semialdehyde dehydrogenase [Nonomuraea glycinis]MCA2178921.1 NAD-dependent succinate-semialdehyde dehydrogenase [Nonomuraea glycinis]GGP08315.1 NAD-dependent succinate-semialdehyde dehydrogenase [Nonomuraea glycinis]
METTLPQYDVIGQVEKGVLIGGRWRPATGGATFPVENPATGRHLCEVSDATPADALAALDAASAAQPGWAAVPPRRRGEILRRAHDLLIERMEEFALLITLEMGKSLAESRAEVRYGAHYLRWFGEEAVRIDGTWKVSEDGTARVLVTRQPVGPCLLITPWNAPLAMPARKIGPAVAAGCTMIVKPAAQTPLTTAALAGVLTEAGLPDGVLNIIPTGQAAAVTEPLLRDGRLRKLSFTGSTPVGRLLLSQAAGTVLRTSMELGGNAPFIVCEDADLDAAVDGAMTAKLRNIGEACIAANRFLVHAGVAEEFTRKLVARMGTIALGAGTDPAADLGPLIDERQRRRVADLVDETVAAGARVRAGAVLPDGPGYFYPPTVLTGIPAGARITREEIFGPVAAIRTFTTEDEALRDANDTEFGLVGYLYTRDLNRALRMSERLETGMVGLNRGYVSDPSAPFGGMKQSGIGREGGNTGIDEYLEQKYLAIDLAPHPESVR